MCKRTWFDINKTKHCTSALPAKKCSSKSGLEDHEKLHAANVTPRICETRRPSFKFLAHLVLHRRKHIEQLLSARSYCGKQFSTKDCLRAHMVRHAGGYPLPSVQEEMLPLQTHRTGVVPPRYLGERLAECRSAQDSHGSTYRGKCVRPLVCVTRGISIRWLTIEPNISGRGHLCVRFAAKPVSWENSRWFTQGSGPLHVQGVAKKPLREKLAWGNRRKGVSVTAVCGLFCVKTLHDSYKTLCHNLQYTYITSYRHALCLSAVNVWWLL